MLSYFYSTTVHMGDFHLHQSNILTQYLDFQVLFTTQMKELISKIHSVSKQTTQPITIILDLHLLQCWKYNRCLSMKRDIQRDRALSSTETQKTVLKRKQTAMMKRALNVCLTIRNHQQNTGIFSHFKRRSEEITQSNTLRSSDRLVYLHIHSLVGGLICQKQHGSQRETQTNTNRPDQHIMINGFDS